MNANKKCTATFAPQTWNLTTDWSDANNPFGVWSLFQAPGQLFTGKQLDYWRDGKNQKAWAAAPADPTGQDPLHVPYWVKVTSVSSCPCNPGFFTAGTVAVSTAQFVGNNGRTSIAWTSPRDGQALIQGGVWLSKFHPGRPQAWELSHEGTLLTFGALSDSDSYRQNSPFLFANGSGDLRPSRFRSKLATRSC